MFEKIRFTCYVHTNSRTHSENRCINLFDINSQLPFPVLVLCVDDRCSDCKRASIAFGWLASCCNLPFVADADAHSHAHRAPPSPNKKHSRYSNDVPHAFCVLRRAPHRRFDGSIGDGAHLSFVEICTRAPFKRWWKYCEL